MWWSLRSHASKQPLFGGPITRALLGADGSYMVLLARLYPWLVPSERSCA